jgi:apolipoprotein N-acyltransferase
VVLPDGSLAHRAGVFTRDVSVTEVPLSDARTPATRLGAAPELVLTLLGVGAVVVALRRRRSTSE